MHEEEAFAMREGNEHRLGTEGGRPQRGVNERMGKETPLIEVRGKPPSERSFLDERRGSDKLR